MKKIAIIGGGPRGLSALESLYTQMAIKDIYSVKINVTIFEPRQIIGTSHVWAMDQAETNWANISERFINELPGREEIKFNGFTIPKFPNYIDWLNKKLDYTLPDTYPLRSDVGKYLSQRYLSIAEILIANNCLDRKPNSVTKITYTNNKVLLTNSDNEEYIFDEVVLAIGHQSTTPDDQLKQWRNYCKKHNSLKLFEDAYPVQPIIENVQNKKHSNIALRGFGLSSLDVIRAIVKDAGAKFIIEDENSLACKYVPNPQKSVTIIPFSLDGKTIVPKPLNKKVDDQFAPNKTSLAAYAERISAVANAKVKVSGNGFLVEAITEVVAPIYFAIINKDGGEKYSTEEIKETTMAWLKNENVAHTLIQKNHSNLEKTIQSFIDMSIGKKQISLDYCIGQVWRHCQRTLYTEFSHANVPSPVVKSVLELDERIKRYSYGPPVESMQQIIALITAKVLNANLINDPTIKTDPNGWLLSKNDESINAEVMINCVLDAPQLIKVNAPIVQQMLADDIIKPIHTELGIETNKDATIVSETIENFIPIAVIGRLAKGSAVGVDAILECFGSRINDWATGVVSRLY